MTIAFGTLLKLNPFDMQNVEVSNDAQFTLDINVPLAQTIMSEVSRTIATIERQSRAAVLLAFLDDEALPGDIETLVREFAELPLVVTRLSVSSVTVTIKGKPDEVAAVLRQVKPRPDWRNRLIVAVMVIFAAIGGRLSNLPEGGRIRQEVARVCGELPRGTEVTLKFMDQEVKIPCSSDSLEAVASEGAPPHRTDNSHRYLYDIELEGDEAARDAVIARLRAIPGVEPQTRFIFRDGRSDQWLRVFAGTPLQEEQIRAEATSAGATVCQFTKRSSAAG